MTSSHAGPINKSSRTPQPTREQRRSFKKPHTTMNPDSKLVCSGLMTKLIYRSTTFRHQFRSFALNAVLGKIRTSRSSFLRPCVMIFEKVTSSKLQSPLVLRTTNPLIGNYHTAQDFTRTNSTRYDESSTAQLSFVAIC